MNKPICGTCAYWHMGMKVVSQDGILHNSVNRGGLSIRRQDWERVYSYASGLSVKARGTGK